MGSNDQHRVAVLPWRDDSLLRSIADTGMKITYVYNGDFERDHIDPDGVPPFDFLAASTSEIEDRRSAMEFALSLVRARLPIAYVIGIGHRDSDRDSINELASIHTGETNLPEYNKIRMMHRGYESVAGIRKGGPYEWPPDADSASPMSLFMKTVATGISKPG